MFDFNYYGLKPELEADVKSLPDLCHKCGKCCRSATTYHNHQRLTELAEAGDKEASDFLSVFEPFASLEEARQAEPEQVEQVLKIAEARSDMDASNITFYHCRYVSPEGMCTIYEKRPRCCREAPGNGWSVMPPGCGFEGWQFEQREKQKKIIRQLKTSTYILSALSPDGVHHPLRPDTTIEDLNTAIAEKIKPWQPFGADYW